MGAIVPQVVSEDRASGAQIVDGGLRFDSNKNQFLTRTPDSAGNQKTWTWSGWVKRGILSSGTQTFFSAGYDAQNYTHLRIVSSDRIRINDEVNGVAESTRLYDDVLRDASGWYHVVFAIDTTQSTAQTRTKTYLNGRLLEDYGGISLALNDLTIFNTANPHTIGAQSDNVLGGDYFDGSMSQVYFIDGQQLDASYFGFTDPLTNTWRPKKLDITETPGGSWGTNGFYLPFDGSAPIGEDKSGNGNNWTPVSFGGSNTIEKATGALPILNTDGGGKVARVGVRTDENASSLVLALPLVGVKDDVSNQINSGSSTKTVTANGAVANSDSNFYGGSYLFDGSNDYISISSSTDFNNIPGDFTIEYWVKHTGTGAFQYHFSLNNTTYVYVFWTEASPNGPYLRAVIQSNTLYNNNSGDPYDFPPNEWAHIAVVRSGSGSNNCKLFVNGQVVAQATITTTINEPSENLMLGQNTNNDYYLGGNIQDFRVYKGVAKYTSNFIPASTNPDILPDTPSGVSGSSKLTKITDGAVSFDGSGDYLSVGGGTDMQLGTGDFTIETFGYFNSVSSGQIYEGRPELTQGDYISIYFTSGLVFYTNSAVRITASNVKANKWYHIALVRESSTTQLYVDGISAGSYSDTTDYTVRSDGPVIGVSRNLSNNPLNGFLSNLRIVKGTALYTSNFTPPTTTLTDVTNTKLLCCQSNTSATAAAVAPGSITANGNAAATNFNPFTTDINTVRGQETGYCTLNPLKTGSAYTLKNGNLSFTSSSNWDGTCGTFLVSSGKWYYEVTRGAGTSCLLGWCVPENYDETTEPGDPANSSVWRYRDDGTKRNGEAGGQSYAATWTSVGDVVGCALDLDAGTIRFYKNGIDQGIAYSNLSGKVVSPVIGFYNCTSDTQVNFGQKPFKFPPPEGFLPLNAANARPSTVIARPDQYVGVTTYVGNESSRVINCGFKPDFVWIKEKAGNYHHAIYDSVRGPLKSLSSSRVDIAEQTETEGLNSFVTNGFSFAGGGPGFYYVNRTGGDYVAWTWKAGGNSNTFNIDDVGYATASAAGLTGGTITPTGASVNTKSGFSIITYTGNTTSSGATLPHGLNAVPKMVHIKSRDSVYNWISIITDSSGQKKSGYLDLNLALGNDNSSWDTSVITLSSSPGVTSNGGTYVAYCWAEIPGFSKFGSYTGNGLADGPFIELGFRPAVIITKAYGTTSQWGIWDAERDPYNPVGRALYPSLSNGEEPAGTYPVDFLSNGFKVRSTANFLNATSGVIYAAWAEAPTFNLYGAQSNAR